MSATNHSAKPVRISEKAWVSMGLSISALGGAFMVGLWVAKIEAHQTSQDDRIAHFTKENDSLKSIISERDKAVIQIQTDIAVIKNDMAYIKKAVTK